MFTSNHPTEFVGCSWNVVIWDKKILAVGMKFIVFRLIFMHAEHCKQENVLYTHFSPHNGQISEDSRRRVHRRRGEIIPAFRGSLLWRWHPPTFLPSPQSTWWVDRRELFTLCCVASLPSWACTLQQTWSSIWEVEWLICSSQPCVCVTDPLETALQLVFER